MNFPLNIFQGLKKLNYFNTENEVHTSTYNIQKFYLNYIMYLSTISDYEILLVEIDKVFILMNSESKNLTSKIIRDFEIVLKTECMQETLNLHNK